jgi:hypothetical protein
MLLNLLTRKFGASILRIGFCTNPTIDTFLRIDHVYLLQKVKVSFHAMISVIYRKKNKV